MKSILKPLGIAAAVVAAAALTLAAVAIWLFDADAYKSELEALFERQTGHALKISGELSLSLFPGVGVRLGHTALPNPPDFGDGNLAEFETLRVDLKLLPLLVGSVAPERVSVKGLKVYLLQSDEGRRNFDHLVTPTEPGPQPPALLSLGALQIENALISYSDGASGKTFRVSQLNLESDFHTGARPAPVTAQFRFHDAARRLEGTGSVDAALSMDAAGRTVTAQRWSTRLVVEGAGPGGDDIALRAEGRGDYDAKAQMLRIEALEIAAGSVPAGEQTVEVQIPKASVDLAAGTASVDQFTVSALTLGAGGELTARDLWRDPTLSATLRVAQFDPRALMARLAPAPEPNRWPQALAGAGSLESTVKVSRHGITLDPVVLMLGGARLSGRIELGLSPQWPLSTALAVEIRKNAADKPLRVSLRGAGRADDNAQVYRLDDLELTLDAVSIRAKVELDAGGDALAYRAALELPAFNARALLDTLEQPVPQTQDPEALTRIAAETTISGRGADLTLDPLTLRLDDTRIKGALSMAEVWSARPTVNFILDADTLNAGRYLPFTLPGSGGDTPALTIPGVLQSVDLNGRLRLGALIVGELVMDNIDLVARSKNGRLELRPGSAARGTGPNGRVAALKPSAVVPP